MCTQPNDKHGRLPTMLLGIWHEKPPQWINLLRNRLYYKWVTSDWTAKLSDATLCPCLNFFFFGMVDWLFVTYLKAAHAAARSYVFVICFNEFFFHIAFIDRWSFSWHKLCRTLWPTCPYIVDHCKPLTCCNILGMLSLPLLVAINVMRDA